MADRQRITKRTVEAARPPEGKDTWICDTEIAGFRLRIRTTGRKTYEVRYYAGRRERLFVIGDHGSPWTADEARKRATSILRDVENGIDPQEERRAGRKAITVRELIDRYLKDGPTDKPNKRASSWATDTTNLRRHVEPLLGARAVREITPADLARWQKDVATGKTAKITKTKKRGRSVIRGGRGAAIRAMRSLSGMFSWAAGASQGLIPANPAANVEKMQDGKRERFLSPEEAVTLWTALAELETPPAPNKPAPIRADHADAFRLLALTGARRGEILGLRWDEIKWERPSLELAPDRHKAGAKGRSRIISLDAAAIEVLRRRQREVLPRNARHKKPIPWVFPKDDGSGPIEPPKNAWHKVRAKAEMPDLRLHDLRHTYASLLLAEGTPLALVGKALGHTKAATTERYAHLRDEATRTGATLVASIYTPSSASPPADSDTGDAQGEAGANGG